MARSGRTGHHYALFLTSATISVTVTAPLPAAVVTTADVAVTWTFAPGTQASYRIIVFEDAAETIIKYDSGVVASGGQSATIPAGQLDDLTNYFLRVQITTTVGQAGESDQVPFSTAFTPSVNVTNQVASLDGGRCPGSAADALPAIVIDWDQVVPGVGETFIQYDVKRRKAGESTWVRIAIITAIATTTYVDHNVEPWTTYEYSIVWQAETALGILVSSDPSPPPNEQQQFDYLFVHVVGTPASFLRFDSLRSSMELDQDTAFKPVWGRQLPTATIGEFETRALTVDGLPEIIRGTQWAGVEDLVGLQRTAGVVLCARPGRSGELLFCNLGRQSKETGEKTDTTRLTFREIFFEEAV